MCSLNWLYSSERGWKWEKEGQKKDAIYEIQQKRSPTCCGEYLSVNSQWCRVAGIVAEKKNIARSWLFKG